MACVRRLAGAGLAVAWLTVGCGGNAEADDGLSQGVGVGDPCVPAAEQHTEFGGFDDLQVTVETGHAECESGLCLANHFRGRASCPYGQTQEEAAEWASTNDWGNRCRVPGADGTETADRVSVPVPPQLYERRASVAVHCSCRCANADGRTDDGESYCQCPIGSTCEPLVPDLGLGSAELAGSYCVPEGAEYDSALAAASPYCTLDFHYPGGWREHPYQCGDAIPD